MGRLPAFSSAVLRRYRRLHAAERRMHRSCGSAFGATAWMADTHLYRARVPTPSRDGNRGTGRREGKVQSGREGLYGRQSSDVAGFPRALPDEESTAGSGWAGDGMGLCVVGCAPRGAAALAGIDGLCTPRAVGPAAQAFRRQAEGEGTDVAPECSARQQQQRTLSGAGREESNFSKIDTMGEGKQQSVRQALLVGDTTLDPLGRLLERDEQAPRLKTKAAPYGQIFQILLDPTHPSWTPQPDILVVWTTPQLTLPSFARLLRFEYESAQEEFDDALHEAEQFADAVLRAAGRVGTVIVPTWVLPDYERWIQSLAWRHNTGAANLLARANLVLAEKFSAASNIFLLDAAYWHAAVTQPAYDPRMFAVAKILYSQPLYAKAAAEMKAVLRGAAGLAKKVVVCDLDNTLWGGVVGDDGAQNLKLGAPDPLGECFVAFQETIKALRSRGIVLAIASKNDETLALQTIEEHPAMVLRKADFAAWRINWNDKAKNLVELAEELNLGLDSFVFLDDSPQERDQVKQLLPQVFVPDLPQSPSNYAPFLTALACFETPSLGKEDFERTAMYQAERGRKEAMESMDLSGDVESWLKSLEIEVRAAPLRKESLPRAAQLLNKTNQFNLALRRLDEKSFWDWAQEPANSTYTFHVSDRFGDFGLAALASVEVKGTEARIVDFVMSCRVMGKKVEEALLGYTLGRAQAAGAERCVALPADGPRNQPAKGFFAAKKASAEDEALDPARVAIPSQISVKEES